MDELIAEIVNGQLAEMGTTAKVSKWDGKENVPLRDVLNFFARELIGELTVELNKFLDQESKNGSTTI